MSKFSKDSFLITKNYINLPAETSVVILFYFYTRIKDPEFLMLREKTAADVLGLKGRIIIAKEGINVTLEGSKEMIERYINHLKGDKRFKKIDVKWSIGNGNVFPKLQVKIRDEIVSQKFGKHINPQTLTGRHLSAKELYKWYREQKDDFIILDMRSKYETMCGVFDKTIDIDVEASRDLVKSKELEGIKKAEAEGKKIVTVCTGGVRCEKMSAYLIDIGLNKKNVYQLQGGIHSYMQEFPAEDFQGTLYTFDGRKTMHFGGERKIIGKCFKCDISSEEVYDVLDDDIHEHQRIICGNCVLDFPSARRGNIYRNKISN